MNTPGRPSLYIGNDVESPSAANPGILDALEPRAGRRLIGRQAVLLGVAMLLTVALYMFGRTTDVRRYLSPAADDGTVVGPTIVKKEEPPPTAAAALASIAEESNAATIIAETPQTPAVPVTNDTLTGLDAGAVTVTDAGSKEPVPAVKESKAKLVKKPKNRPVAHASATAAKRVASAGTGKDKDVDLIAALLAHVSLGGAPGREAKQKAAEVAGKQDKRAGANRDIVVRNAGEPIDALVKRCHELGFVEGELCRLRICSGLWGKDPACPGNQVSGN